MLEGINFNSVNCIVEYGPGTGVFTKKFNLSNIYNIQVKYHKGEVYLIEINTRMSGGTFKSCMSGINLMSKTVDLLNGEKVESQINKLKEIKITQKNDCYIDLYD